MDSKLLICIVLSILVVGTAHCQLSENFYTSSCPGGVALVTQLTRSRVSADRTMAPSLLRLHFHDCFVQGCDGSVLLDNPSGQGEKESLGNKGTLRGFDVIDDIKKQLEALCPGVISCADILALVARDAVVAIGGTNWSVPLGRRDGSGSSATLANSNLPPPNSNFNALSTLFTSKGFTNSELVTLSGAHTVGVTLCSTIQPRLYNFSSTTATDPAIDPTFAASLKRQCAFGDTTTRIKLDQTTALDTWDQNYYSNVLRGKAVFQSDASLRSNGNSLSRVNQLARSGSVFNRDFGNAMVKMGRIQILTGAQGQIRKNCRAVNS
ncbi:hypothetical protein R1flu_027824 [Riccia fluitans]|uniref:Peroxidase n=1 Tax=Riccia fluitans TaxID=41844 RepID=A0ABD1XMV8_9MARC